jgi:hypothetical protein
MIKDALKEKTGGRIFLKANSKKSVLDTEVTLSKTERMDLEGNRQSSYPVLRKLLTSTGMQLDPVEVDQLVYQENNQTYCYDRSVH